MTEGQAIKLFEYMPSETHGSYGVFVIGCADTYRNTVISQQNRALTLVNALAKARRLKTGQTVGVVGGGVAGLTAAMQCVKKGAKVTVFEKSQDVLSMFHEANHRFLHPSLFNWPYRGWDIEKTDHDRLGEVGRRPLPHLNWKFDSAANIARRMRKEFKKFEKDYCQGNTNKEGWIRVERLKQVTFESDWSPSRKPTVQSPNGSHPFDHLLIAVGFGEDERMDGSSYWQRDSLSQIRHISNGMTHLVVGTGDGGIFDYLRLMLDIKDERWLVKFLKEWDKKERYEIEYEIAGLRSAGDISVEASELQRKYQELAARCHKALKWLQKRRGERVQGYLRDDTRVFLIPRGDSVITGRAAPIHRLLIALLMQRDCGILWKRGSYVPVTGGGWKIDGTEFCSSNSEYKLVLRIGPLTGQSALEKFSPRIYEFAKNRLATMSEFDFHNTYSSFDEFDGGGGSGLPKGPLPPAAPSGPDVGGFAVIARRDDVVHENPYLLGGKFIGRKKEQDYFTEWLIDPSPGRRMLFVCDYGGAGKTALVWHWLNREDVRKKRSELGYREYWGTFYAREYGWKKFAESLALKMGVDVPEKLNDPIAWGRTLKAIIEYLQNPKQDSWLIVLDGMEREMESFASEATLHMDSEQQDIRKEAGNVDVRERFLLSRQFSGFLTELLETRAKVLVTSRTLPEDFWSGARLLPGAEEYPFEQMSMADAREVWRLHTQKPGKSRLIRFFRVIGCHPQVIAIVAAAVNASEDVDFEDWIGHLTPQETRDYFDDEGNLKTRLRHKWLELATADLVGQRSRAWMLLCHIIGRSNASSLERLEIELVKPGSSPFAKVADLIESLLQLQRRNLLGYDTSRKEIDVHPVVRSHVGKYLIRIWAQPVQERDKFASDVLQRLRESRDSGDALLRLLSTESLDQAARFLDEEDPVARDKISYTSSFSMLKEFFPKTGNRTFLDNLPCVSLRKLQATVLLKAADAARATGEWDDAAILNRRAKLSFELCGEEEKARQCQVGENWQQLYGGFLLNCENNSLRLLLRNKATSSEDGYYLALALAIRKSKWANPFLEKLGHGNSRWSMQTTAEAWYYLDDYRRAEEMLSHLKDNLVIDRDIHPAQQLWEWVTLGMAKLRQGKIAASASLLEVAREQSMKFSYRIVLLFSQSSYAEYLLEDALSMTGTDRRVGLEKSKALFARTIGLDPKQRFQIPMSESYLGLARAEIELGDKVAAIFAARKAHEIAMGGHGGFGYFSGLRRINAFFKKHFRKETLPVESSSRPKAVLRHLEELDRYMRKFLRIKR
jgi:tetratricopeptide (TPR) repeat protein